jgi:hypothetical protein
MAFLIQAQSTSALVQQISRVPSSHALFFPKQRRFRHTKACPVKSTKKRPAIVAAISEKLDKIEVITEEKTVKRNVRAVITVRRKLKEDIKDAIANNLDALSDMVGRNVVLELISTQIDPSE